MYCKNRLQIHDLNSVFTARTRRSRRPYIQRCHSVQTALPRSCTQRADTQYTKSCYFVRRPQNLHSKDTFSTNTRHTCQTKSKDTIFARSIRLRILFIFCLYDYLKHRFRGSTNEANTKKNSCRDDCAGACHKLYFLSSFYKWKRL